MLLVGAIKIKGIYIMKKIFSFDAETNGLWGQAFAIGAVVRNTDGTTTEWVGRCPIEGPISDWVAENVLPNMEEIQETYNAYRERLKAFSEFYMKNKIIFSLLPIK